MRRKTEPEMKGSIRLLEQSKELSLCGFETRREYIKKKADALMYQSYNPKVVIEITIQSKL